MNLVRDQGLPDFVMMDHDQVNEDGFFENLRLRFKQKQIYTYIGEQLVSMNPFTRGMAIYGPEVIDSYRNRYLYEVQPHIYAVAEDTFRALMQSKRDQCMIVTGESGAGKTEATKIFMNYIARVSPGGASSVKDKLLDSNPVLEAFGNAKTLRNDNSSRFGKYMEIQFDGAGRPLGGKILQYLLEKSRVVTRFKGERSYHIFYQILSQKEVVAKLGLSSDPEKYTYLALSGEYKCQDMDDNAEYKLTSKAMGTEGFSDADKYAVIRTVMAILLLGNVEFEGFEDGKVHVEQSRVTNPELVEKVAELLRVSPEALGRSLVQRELSTGAIGGESAVTVLFNLKQAKDARDSLASAVYNALFSWVVGRLNESIELINKNTQAEVMIGILDIYGFEIFDENSFEQLCINFLNEKLQQQFIQLVLKTEQQEYISEGIEWTEIDYFDNGPICELIEGKMGVFKLLDEACAVGQPTTRSIMDKFDDAFGPHPHYKSLARNKDRTIHMDAFRVVHYAGEVDYNVSTFAAKNVDTLFDSMVFMLQNSTDTKIQALFPQIPANKRGRPTTGGTQFTGNVTALLAKLKACEPHYIRCVKSNETKSGFTLDEARVRHQARYLNLVETVRVRRAGFCNKQHYERFFRRYKTLLDSWPHYSGDDKSGATAIIHDLKIAPGEYRMGKTKLFIRNAQTLMKFEEARTEKLPIVAIVISRWYRGHMARKRYRRLLAVLTLQRAERCRRARARLAMLRDMAAKKKAAVKIQTRYRGFKVRKYTKENRDKLLAEREEARRLRKIIRIQTVYRHYLKRRYLTRFCRSFKKIDYKSASTNYGKGVAFPRFKPAPLQKVADIFRWWHWKSWAHRKVSKLSKTQAAAIRQKIQALTIFSGKKPWGCSRPFKADYVMLEAKDRTAYKTSISQLFSTRGDKTIKFADTLVKVNRKFKSQFRCIVVTDKNLYKFMPSKFKLLKPGTPLKAIKSIHLSPHSDAFLVIKCASPHRDLVLDCGTRNSIETYSELVTVLVDLIKGLTGKTIPVEFSAPFMFNNSRKEESPGKNIRMAFSRRDSRKQYNLNGTSQSFLEVNAKQATVTVLYSK